MSDHYMGARTFTFKFDGRGQIRPSHIIDAHDMGNKGRSIRFVLDNGSELEVQNTGDGIRITATGESHRREDTRCINVVPEMSNVVRVRPGSF